MPSPNSTIENVISDAKTAIIACTNIDNVASSIIIPPLYHISFVLASAILLNISPIFKTLFAVNEDKSNVCKEEHR